MKIIFLENLADVRRHAVVAVRKQIGVGASLSIFPENVPLVGKTVVPVPPRPLDPFRVHQVALLQQEHILQSVY